MKMPASGGDPVSTTLRLAFSPSSKAELDCGIEASAKRVLLSRIEFEPTTNYQSSVLSSLKSKYIVINHKAHVDGAKTIVNGTSGNKKSNNVTLPVPKLTLFPPERVQLGYRGNTNIGSGMANMGNTCYLNSTLQALFHVPALVNWLMSETAHQKCEQNSDYQMHPDDITCSVIKTFKCSQQKTGACMKPISVYSKLKAICKHLSHGSQEDAHEFMRYLLESLEKSYLTRFQGHKLDSASKETTPINQIFGGYIRTEVTCLSCNAVSTTFQHFQDLPLDIRKASTLNDALAGYFERERLPEGEDAYKCEKCNRKVPATKKFSIEKPPNVLCIQLKRFSAANGKITKQVQLPENLDVTRFTSPSVQPRHPVTYKLVSMVTHMGQSANCGHYTAIALASNNRYYQFDDSSVRQIPTCTVLSMSAYLVLYEIDRPFATVYPRPFSAPAAASWKESPNNGEKPDSWSECESTSINGNGNGIDRESKREGSESGSRVVNQLKHGKVNTPPVSPTREPPSTNHRHGAGPRNGGQESKGTSTSLVPYESDASSESDAENKDRSELERLLTKSCAKGWQVTEQNDSLTDGTKACTTSWDVTEVKIPKFARNLSDTELNGRKKKKVKTSGSDSEVDKISNKSEDKKKRRTSILERYKTNFGGSGSKEGKSSQEINKDGDKKIWSESVNRGFEQNQENSKSKSFQFSRPVAVNGHNGTVNGNGSINSSKNANNNGDTNGNSEDKSGENSPRRSGFDRVTDDDPSEAEEKAFCSSIVREVERKKEIIGVLLQNSHRGYGTSAVKTWNGTQTNFEREAEEERRESTKRTYDSYYNDEFDKGKAKKLKTDDYSKERDRPRYNAFQERANQQQQQHHHHHHNHHWRSNNGGRYPSDFRRHNKQKPFNSGYYNKNNNWNYRRKKNFPSYKHSSYNNYRH